MSDGFAKTLEKLSNGHGEVMKKFIAMSVRTLNKDLSLIFQAAEPVYQTTQGRRGVQVGNLIDLDTEPVTYDNTGADRGAEHFSSILINCVSSVCKAMS